MVVKERMLRLGLVLSGGRERRWRKTSNELDDFYFSRLEAVDKEIDQLVTVGVPMLHLGLFL